MMRWTVVGVVVLVLAVGNVEWVRADLIINGGFETGDLTGWTLSGNTDSFGVNTDPSFVHSGSVGISYGQVGTLGFLSQTITTTPGASYTLDFWQDTLAGTPNEFQAYWDGILILDLVDSPIASGFTEHTFTEVATGASTEVKFGFRQDPSYSAFDDVSVELASVPEPSTWLFFATGLLGLRLTYGWRQRKQSVYPPEGPVRC